MSTKKKKTYVVCWKRGNEFNYFYCEKEHACMQFVFETVMQGYVVEDILIIDEEEEQK